MADYTLIGWVNEGTKVGPTNLNKMDNAILDAVTHHRRGTLAARPPAAAGNKNWLYFVTDPGLEQVYLSDGATWLPYSIPAAAEAFRVIGDPGNPAFTAGWGHVRNISNGNFEYAAFYKDPFGRVHLKGSVRATSAQAADAVIFQVPVGYRPNRYIQTGGFLTGAAGPQLYMEGGVAPAGAGAPGGLRIASAMAINTNLQLDNLSWRAGDGTGA